MPSEAAHLAVAERNQLLIDHLLKDLERFPDWITTVAFYKALHLVEAAFARDPAIRHGRNHEQRERFLKSTRKYSHIYKHYRPLWAASTVARYLEDHSTNDEHSTFSEYMNSEDVRRKILGHYLHQLEASVKKMIDKKE